MYTNTNQFTTMKRPEVLELAKQKKTHIIVICYVKPKNLSKRTELDYVIPDYSLHLVNLDSNIRRGIVIYTHSRIENCIIHMSPDIKFREVYLLKIRLWEGDDLLFSSFYRSPTPSSTSEENNANLGNLLRYVFGKKYSHQYFVEGSNLRGINWSTWTTPFNKESKQAQFIETFCHCYLYQHLLVPFISRSTDNLVIIDLVLTDEVMQVSDIEYHAQLDVSDHSLCEKCPNTEFFLVRIFPYSN